jgi:hypothetical protein
MSIINLFNYKYTVEFILEPRPPNYDYEIIDKINICEIRQWLSENNINDNESSDDYIWYFYNIEDAIAFILRWS